MYQRIAYVNKQRRKGRVHLETIREENYHSMVMLKGFLGCKDGRSP